MNYNFNQIKIINRIVFVIVLLINSIYAEGKLEDPIKWSQYQGKKTWQEAKDHCHTMKMRLPTISELKQADEIGTTKGWRKNGTRYWSVNKNLESNSYTYIAINILMKNKEENEENHKIESLVGVFCANVTEESLKYEIVLQRLEELSFQYSDYLGEMTWEEANKKCKSLNMRLPTSDEIKEVYNEGLIKSWQFRGQNYNWAFTPHIYIPECIYTYGGEFCRDKDRDVRCRR